LAATGMNPISISNDALYQLVSNVLAISSAIYLIWKNFSLTPQAQTSDEVLAALKDGTLAIAEVVAFINESRNNTNTSEKVNQTTKVLKNEYK
jgi:cell shape-determining protein MreC